MGVDITYECISSCNYRVYHSTYFDCSGSFMVPYFPLNTNNPPPAPTNFDFDFTGIPNTPGQVCTDPTPVGNWVYISYTDVTPICPTATTRCTDALSPIRGVSEVKYYRDYNFCNTNCNSYRIEWELCCRNNAITSLNAPGGVSIYTGATTINKTIVPCNNSPVFSNPPVPYICAGQAFTFNQGVVDPDGDSLVYSLGQCFDGPGVQVPYLATYSPTNPLGNSWSVNVNSFTGDITIIPNPTGNQEVAVLCLYVTEYRNGVQIGQVVRDIQVTAIDCNALGQVNTAPTLTSLTNLSPGASATGLTVTACSCQEVCFDLPVTDPDSGQTYTIYWNQSLPGTFADANNPLIAIDTIVSVGTTPTAQFCWVPTQLGAYSFVVTVADDGCPLLGQNQVSVVINVVGCSLDPYADVDRTGCYDYRFTAFPCGGTPPFTFNWSGTGGLTGTDSILNYTYPGPGTYFHTLSITDGNGFTSFTTDTVVVVNDAVANAGSDFAL
ncbi:MAG: hypothetical protein EAZ89_13230, partial [Bacteroidetes bacterium]